MPTGTSNTTPPVSDPDGLNTSPDSVTHRVITSLSNATLGYKEQR